MLWLAALVDASVRSVAIGRGGGGSGGRDARYCRRSSHRRHGGGDWGEGSTGVRGRLDRGGDWGEGRLGRGGCGERQRQRQIGLRRQQASCRQSTPAADLNPRRLCRSRLPQFLPLATTSPARNHRHRSRTPLPPPPLTLPLASSAASTTRVHSRSTLLSRWEGATGQGFRATEAAVASGGGGDCCCGAPSSGGANTYIDINVIK